MARGGGEDQRDPQGRTMLAVCGNVLRDLSTEPRAVVGAAVLRIDLRRVPQIEAATRGREGQDAMAVADAWHGLGGFLAERPIAQDVTPLEARIHLPERRDVVRQKLLGVHPR